MARIDLDLAHSYKAQPREDADYAARMVDGIHRFENGRAGDSHGSGCDRRSRFLFTDAVQQDGIPLMSHGGGCGRHLASFELLNFAEAGSQRISTATVFSTGQTEQTRQMGQKEHD